MMRKRMMRIPKRKMIRTIPRMMRKMRMRKRRQHRAERSAS
jgi:hypothetical protein